jgi:hypothetical protein
VLLPSLGGQPDLGHGMVTLVLIVHLLLGQRRLQDLRYYQDDPLVKRLLGVSRLPDVATVSRTLAGMDGRSVEQLREVNRQLVLARLQALRLSRVTLDFDGSVLTTGRFAEGSAVDFNRKKKGQRSYYPLFCTIAQTGQVLDVWHRPGNVHDSNGAKSWPRRHRFVCIRQRTRVQHKEAVRLDLFVPYEYGYDFKVIVTNKRVSAKKVLTYHNGRGAQEGLFAELKSQTQMDYVPTRKLAGNQVYVLAAMPQGQLTLTMSAKPAARGDMLHYLDRLEHAA